MNQFSYTLPEKLQTAVDHELAVWTKSARVQQLWNQDAALWTGNDEASWLGWLSSPADMQAGLDELQRFSEQLHEEGYTHVVLLGMGGSSMAPEVFSRTFGAQDGWPELLVLDSTDPGQIIEVEKSIDLAHSVFIIASKSGSTLEPNILKAYFLERLVKCVGAEQAAKQFIAITDPGSSLDTLADTEGFLKTFYGNPEIGGRFSVLSVFGLVPAALMGLDCARLLDSTLRMVAACREELAAENPGVALGCILGTAASLGRDKLTIIASPGLDSFGAWLEQLIAESTGKQGKGVLPLDGETLMAPQAYGRDRIFVYLHLATDADKGVSKQLDQLEAAGFPVLRIDVQDRYDVGQEFFRWEMATAVAGAVLGMNPFDQPDVEASKVETRKLTALIEAGESLPVQTRLAEENGLVLYSDKVNAAELRALAGEQASLSELLGAHLSRIKAGDYLALLAYLARNADHQAGLQQVRQQILEKYRVATCLGFGPRFLHSTGQYYKGGPNTGVFLQITAAPPTDLPVPGHRYSFGAAEAAQAQGDFDVLAKRGRRLLRVHLSSDITAGLARLAELVA